jgi:hypothetical protein
MKVTGVSIVATTAATNAHRPALTPELLAAVGAKYSRSNDGLESILARSSGVRAGRQALVAAVVATMETPVTFIWLGPPNFDVHTTRS